MSSRQRILILCATGLWLAAAQTKNPSAPQVVELMRQQFARIGDSLVPAAELAARKATLVGSYGRSLETTAGLAQQVAELAVYGLPLADIGQYIAKVQAEPAYQDGFLKAQRLEASLETPAQFKALVAKEFDEWGRTIADAHIPKVD